jgi:hypothetical protein
VEQVNPPDSPPPPQGVVQIWHYNVDVVLKVHLILWPIAFVILGLAGQEKLATMLLSLIHIP